MLLLPFCLCLCPRLLHASAKPHVPPPQGLAALNPEPQPAPSAAAAGRGSPDRDGSSGSSSSPRQRLMLLGDAAAYLSDIVSSGAGGDEVLLEAARGALRQVQEQQEMAKLDRPQR